MITSTLFACLAIAYVSAQATGFDDPIYSEAYMDALCGQTVSIRQQHGTFSIVKEGNYPQGLDCTVTVKHEDTSKKFLWQFESYEFVAGDTLTITYNTTTDINPTPFKEEKTFQGMDMTRSMMKWTTDNSIKFQFKSAGNSNERSGFKIYWAAFRAGDNLVCYGHEFMCNPQAHPICLASALKCLEGWKNNCGREPQQIRDECDIIMPPSSAGFHTISFSVLFFVATALFL